VPCPPVDCKSNFRPAGSGIRPSRNRNHYENSSGEHANRSRASPGTASGGASGLGWREDAPLSEAASHPEELERSKPLAIPPEEVGAMMSEHGTNARSGGLRAAHGARRRHGSVLGFFLAFTNVYVGLRRAGAWASRSPPASRRSRSGRPLLKLGVAKSPMTILENNCMQSTASSPGTRRVCSPSPPYQRCFYCP